MIEVYTDGAYSKSGRGGWAFVAVDNHKELHRASGVIVGTTSQRAELTAALRALQWLDGSGYATTIVSDSAYLTNCFLDGWWIEWKIGGMDGKKVVKNEDLWEPILNLAWRNDIFWKHVKGHGDDLWNNVADDLAVAAKSLMKPPS